AIDQPPAHESIHQSRAEVPEADLLRIVPHLREGLDGLDPRRRPRARSTARWLRPRSTRWAPRRSARRPDHGQVVKGSRDSAPPSTSERDPEKEKGPVN